MGAAALRAQPVNFQPVPAHAERVLGGHFVENLRDRPVLKLDQLTADATNEMVVLRVAVIVLVDLAIWI